MKKSLESLVILVAVPLWIAGCGSAEGPEHRITAPRAPTASYKVPTTKEEKIAAINKAPISEDQKKAAIAQVNAGG